MQRCKTRFRTFFFTSVCKIPSGFARLLRSVDPHTVTGLSSQLLNRPNRYSYQYQRGVSCINSLPHADKENYDGNSHLATTWHTLCTYLYTEPKKTSTRRGYEKHKTGTTMRTTKSGLLRTYVQSGLVADNTQATRQRSCCVVRLSVPTN